HRERLRKRFLSDMGASMQDYELLELLLTLAKPRGDVKPLAKKLLIEFESFSNIISATPEELKRVKGVGDSSVAALKLVQQASLRLLRQDVFNGHILSNWQKLMDYIQAAMGREKVEQLRVLYLNQKNHLIADEVQQRGTINHTPLYPREVIKRALDLGAVAIIIVHNHPSGDPTPSEEDIIATKRLKEAGYNLDIVLHDHVVVGRTNYISFKNHGLL
ncbi:MAG: DNA repair protein RadC, partial [Alphaproteobacteria bacterium]|nr:DNA repair protein RadC [Alphaproteobacteria bacterium]